MNIETKNGKIIISGQPLQDWLEDRDHLKSMAKKLADSSGVTPSLIYGYRKDCINGERFIFVSGRDNSANLFEIRPIGRKKNARKNDKQS